MNREQFIRELERLLKDLPAGEREAAIQYYNDYFDDAGAENEAQVIRELGSPAQVAGTIRDGMSENGEYTERGYENTRFSDPQEVSAGNRTAPAEAPHPRRGADPWKLLAILLLCLLLFPIVVPLFVTFLVIADAVLLGIAGVMIGVAVAAVALPIAGIILMGLAVYNLFLRPGVGIALGGMGCLLLSAGILIFLMAVWIMKILIPFLLRSIVSILRYPLRKAGVVK